MASVDIQAIFEIVQDIDDNNIDRVLVLRYETLHNRGVSIGAFNRSMAKRGVPYRIRPHDDPKKVWLYLSKDEEGIAWGN